MYRYAKVTNGKKRTKREPRIPKDIIMNAGAIKVQPGQKGRKKRYLRSRDVLDVLEQTGTIKKGEISEGTINSRLRRLGFNKPRVYTRNEEKYVNLAQQVDFSVSDNFGVVKTTGDDALIKRLGKGAANPYKNKPGDTSKSKLWICSNVESYSRLTNMLYIVSPGENLSVAADFLNYCWLREDADLPALKLPDRLEFDGGSIGRSDDFRKNMDLYLDIEVKMKGNKSDREKEHQSQGKVERRFRSLWQSEGLWAWKLEKMGVNEIYLSELNALVREECIKNARKDHPMRRGHSVLNVYEAGLQKRNITYNKGEISRGNRELHTDMEEVLFKRMYRTPDQSGLISINNEYYEIQDKTFVLEKIEVRHDKHRRIMGVATDKDTGEIHEFDIRKFDPDVAPLVTPDPTLRETLARREVNIDYSRMSITEPREGMPDNVKRIGSEAKAAKPRTSFSRPQENNMSFDDARDELCQKLNCTWSQIPETIRDLLQLAYDQKKLTPQTLDDLARAVNL